MTFTNSFFFFYREIKEQLGLSGSLCVAQTLEAAAGELGLKQLTGTAMEKASRILDELGC